jgi:cholestenol Delta-isomerase
MGPAQDLFGQLWKEYSLSDSRYLTSDAFVLWMESVTAFLWGPLSFMLVYMICADHPLRHPIQLVVCLGQIYGLILYYATSLFEHYQNDVDFCRPERYYFWFYYAFFNAIWLVIPTRESNGSRDSIRADLASANATQHLSHRPGL